VSINQVPISSTGISPFKANYGFNLSYGRVPSSEQCLPAVEERLEQLSEFQEELKKFLKRTQESTKYQFNKHVRNNPDWKVGDDVWLNSKNISTTRPCPKLDDQWLGPFPISKIISSSAYELTLPTGRPRCFSRVNLTKTPNGHD